MTECVSICYASDDHYAPVMGTSILSLLHHNRDIDSLHIHILSNGLSSDNKRRLKRLIRRYQRECFFYELDEKLRRLAKVERSWNITTYARLFIPDILPQTIGRVLYIDCDTLVIGKIGELFSEKYRDGNIIYGVLDRYNTGSIQRLGLKKNVYINAGVTMMDLKAWRQEHISEYMMNLIGRQEWKFPDQDMLNVVLEGRTGILPMYYNMYMFSRVMPYEAAMELSYKGIEAYYSKADYEYAQRNTAIIHFAGNLFGRPWQKNSRQTDHELFDAYYLHSPWKSVPYKKRAYTKKPVTSIYYWLTEKRLWRSWVSENYMKFAKDYMYFNRLPQIIKEKLRRKRK